MCAPGRSWFFNRMHAETARCAHPAQPAASALSQGIPPLGAMCGAATASAEDNFRIRPGRIRSTRAQQARPFITQALAAAQRTGGSVSRSGDDRSRPTRLGANEPPHHRARATPSSKRASSATARVAHRSRPTSATCGARASPGTERRRGPSVPAPTRPIRRHSRSAAPMTTITSASSCRRTPSIETAPG
jgi:hypothetical protein